MARVCVLCVVGLTPQVLRYAPRIRELGNPISWRTPLPKVTATAQATMLTGSPPAEHGIVANGWLYRDTREVRFWQQSNSLIQVPQRIYDGARTAKLFWWFNQGAPVDWYVTPKPHYGCDGSKVFDIIDGTDSRLERRLGRFPFENFWGPAAGIEASEWIAAAAACVLRTKQPGLTLVYLPHLDYDYQRNGPGAPGPVVEVDRCAATVIDAAREIGASVVVVSEYGLVPVSRPVHLNVALRRAGWLRVRSGPFGEMLDTFGSRAFAVPDHQIAHVYLQGADREAVRRELEDLAGVDAVVDPSDVGLGHPRSGELLALAESDSWFTYQYWLQNQHAPDFARTVDIHRKPGFDPCELFMTSRLRAALRLAQKHAGFRYRMDVVPLDPERVRGSHGLHAPPEQSPIIIGPGAPDDMLDFSDYVKGLLADPRA